MEFFKSLIFVFAPFAAWWFIAKKTKGKGHSAFKRHTWGFLAFMVTGVVLSQMYDPQAPAGVTEQAQSDTPAATVSVETAATAQQSAAAVVKPDIVRVETPTPAAAVKTLGLTPKAYAARINAQFKQSNMAFRFPANPDVGSGEVGDSFQVVLSKYLGLIGNVDKKSGEVVEVMLIGMGDGTADTAANIILVALAMVKAGIQQDKALQDEVAKTVTELIGGDKADSASVSKELGRFKVWHSRNSVVGSVFGVTAL